MFSCELFTNFVPVGLKLVHLPTLEGPGVENVVAWSVKVMNRKSSKTRTAAYHVTLPIRLVEDFDETLSFKQSRSRMIAKLIENYLEGDQINIGSMTKKAIVVALMNQVEPYSAEYTMLSVLKEVFTSQMHDEQSS